MPARPLDIRHLLLAAGLLAPAALLPAQEDCARSLVLAVPALVSGDTTGAVDDYDPGFGCIGPAEGPDHVYQLTPIADGRFDIVAVPGEPQYDIAVYLITDCGDPQSSCVVGRDAHGPGASERIEFEPLLGGVRYYVVVDGYVDFIPNSRPEGPYTLTVDASVVPEDCSATRRPPTLPWHDELDTSIGRHDLDPPPGCALPPQPAADLVYRIDPPYPVRLTVDLSPAGFDAALYALTDCGQPSASCINASDAPGIGVPESIAVDLTPGTPLFVVVDGATLGGRYDIDFRVGETCADPVPVGSVPFSAMGDTDHATNDLDINAGTCLLATRSRSFDVVYELASPADALVDLVLTPLDGALDAMLYVIADCAFPTATCVAAADDGDDGAVETVGALYLLGGQTLYAVVDSPVPGEGGAYRLDIASSAALRLYLTRQADDAALRFAGAASPFDVTRYTRKDRSDPTLLATGEPGPFFNDRPGTGVFFYSVD